MISLRREETARDRPKGVGSVSRGRCLSNYMSIHFFKQGSTVDGRATYCNNTLYFDGLANFVVARVS